MIGRAGWIAGAALAMGLAVAAFGAAGANDDDERAAAARAAADNFQGLLRAELLKALKAGGATGAIAVCREKAPEIATKMGAETGWRIARTSTRVRNPQNAPDAWESGVLAAFAARLEKGENIIRMEHGEVVTLPDSSRAYRYMKAIPMGEACQKCHGTAVDTSLVARIRELYPDDRAVGFATGELRGAFTITQPLP